MAISPQVMSTPKPLQTRRYGKLPTVVRGARYSLSRKSMIFRSTNRGAASAPSTHASEGSERAHFAGRPSSASSVSSAHGLQVLAEEVGLLLNCLGDGQGERLYRRHFSGVRFILWLRASVRPGMAVVVTAHHPVGTALGLAGEGAAAREVGWL
eukprot:9408990-Pyramimonas_sp.AAC.2